jgi:hypothetical protein
MFNKIQQVFLEQADYIPVLAQIFITACTWLKGEGRLWLDVCGVSLEPEQVTQWIACGCPFKRNRLVQCAGY